MTMTKGRSNRSSLLLLVVVGISMFVNVSAFSLAVPADFMTRSIFPGNAFTQVPPNERAAKFSSSQQPSLPTAATVKKPVRYDFGIGKNAPVNNNHQPTIHTPKNAYEACQFLLEYESARDFPSPATNQAAQDEQLLIGNSNLDKRKKSKQKIDCDYKRGSEDVLVIIETESSRKKEQRGAKPTIFANTTTAQLDLNTVWVEMLVHSESSSLASQS